MKERLCTLIREWPDQMVLQHLKERCHAILTLDLRSPVAEVLSALELLLLHTEDWEGYANRENSLRDNHSSIIELIVNWRRLELSCWQTLLEAETKAFEGGVSSWWFHLYNAIVRGPLDLMQQNLDDAIEMSEDFGERYRWKMYRMMERTRRGRTTKATQIQRSKLATWTIPIPLRLTRSVGVTRKVQMTETIK
ncbi:hypothetical protein BT96DRAFT_415984 [Gymnopus androsaceus JB14]|uniref:Uncharacterized protein n=1 Tax=Gymnopus androsaceus JB14 TaxID=1447944 RepID=A0A6A4GTF9_9AGAR|nr:hypothetical protein BT96DRAFT_415984 [Gymnopus androsaceus JB14]